MPTILHPIGFIAALLLGMAMMLVPRRYALAPMLIMACLVSPAQRVVFAGFDFDLLRVMVLFGWTRVLLVGEARGFRWRSMDAMLVLWTISGAVIMTARIGDMATLVYRLGVTFDAIGMYFLCRIMIRDWSDVQAIITSAAIISIPVAAAFLIEHFTRRNMFAVFGGVPEITVIREGKLRCRGPFPHPILAGCFWAAFMPLIASLWWQARPTRWLAPVGLAASAVVVMTTSSATPISAMFLGLLATAMFPLRSLMPLIRWGGLLMLFVLHIVMVNPVWHLLARIQLVGGTGWYRYKMIDEFINNFDQWWVLGTDAFDKWWKYGLEAITNQYVLEGVEGGLLTLVLFIGTIVMTFHGIGRIGRSAGGNRFRQFAAWGMGASLLVHCVSFLGVSYFGQIIVLWFLGLGMVTSLRPGTAPQPRRVYRLVPVRDTAGEARSSNRAEPAGASA